MWASLCVLFSPQMDTLKVHSKLVWPLLCDICKGPLSEKGHIWSFWSHEFSGKAIMAHYGHHSHCQALCHLQEIDQCADTTCSCPPRACSVLGKTKDNHHPNIQLQLASLLWSAFLALLSVWLFLSLPCPDLYFLGNHSTPASVGFALATSSCLLPLQWSWLPSDFTLTISRMWWAFTSEGDCRSLSKGRDLVWKRTVP